MAILKIVILMLTTSLCHCEPPVHYPSQLGNNGYIPPSYHTGPSTQSFAAPTHTYNAHNFGVTPPATSFTPPSVGFTPPAGAYGPPAYGHGSQHGHDNGYDHHAHENEEPKSYEFGYAVKDATSGNDYGRREISDGNTVRGEYRVLLPDGRTQIVTYHADWKTGYHADVRYEGEARYPEPAQTHHHYQKPGSDGGYLYNNPGFGGSLNGFHGNGNSQSPGSYTPTGYQ